MSGKWYAHESEYEKDVMKRDLERLVAMNGLCSHDDDERMGKRHGCSSGFGMRVNSCEVELRQLMMMFHSRRFSCSRNNLQACSSDGRGGA